LVDVMWMKIDKKNMKNNKYHAFGAISKSNVTDYPNCTFRHAVR